MKANNRFWMHARYIFQAYTITDFLLKIQFDYSER